MSEDSNKDLESEDETLSNLLQLDGDRFVIDERSGLWVKFEAKEVSKSTDRPHGVKYSLTLHDRSNRRIMGFDNAHAIELGAKKKAAPKKTYYHWHRDENDSGRPYEYTNAGQLLEDFWEQVDIIVKKYEG
jgi:hypothetical protein